MPATELNCPLTIRLTGHINVAALHQALKLIQERHDILRTRYVLDACGSRIPVPGSATAPLGEMTLSAKSPMDRVEECWENFRLKIATPVDPGALPLHLELARIREDELLLVGVIGHFAWDAASHRPFMNEFIRFYFGVLLGFPTRSTPPLQYSDVARWENGWQTGEVVAANRAYWDERLAGSESFHLPGARQRGDAPSPSGATELEIGGDLFAAAAAYARNNGMTMPMMLAGLIGLTVARWTRQDQALVGHVVSGRSPSTSGIVGCFANVRPLLLDLSDNPGFGLAMRRVRRAYLEAIDPKRPPPDEVLEKLHCPFNVNLQVGPDPQDEPPKRHLGLTIEAPVARPRLKDDTVRDFFFSLYQTPTRVKGRVTFAADRYDTSSVKALTDMPADILAAGLADPEVPLSRLGRHNCSASSGVF